MVADRNEHRSTEVVLGSRRVRSLRLAVALNPE